MPPVTPHGRWLQPVSLAMTQCRRGGASRGIGMALLGLTLLGLLAGACTAAGEASSGESPLIAAPSGVGRAAADSGVGLAPPVGATSRVAAVATPMLPTATAIPVSGPVPLVVLHTNDNWGETEPCG